jgi:glycerol kinase
LTTLACDIKGRPVYALEGAVFIAGAVVQWLRDGLKVIRRSSETERAIKGLKDTHGIYLVPAFVGLGAPYWASEARGLIAGITRGTTLRHIVRASLESIAYQTKDVFDAMRRSFGRNIRELKVDGGACRNNFLMQFQADILGAEIIRPTVVELTAKGVANLAAVTLNLSRVSRPNRVERIFRPSMPVKKREELYGGWLKAVKRAML